MKKNRVIARLDVKGANVVKGIQLECLRVMGKPNALAEEYYLQGADELVYLDIVANLYERRNLINIVNQASENIFIPFTIGGGIRSTNDIRTLLRAGADKVLINTEATNNPTLLRESAETFGSQCIVSSIEAKKVGEGEWLTYADNGRQNTGRDVVEWAKEVEELGVGEIFLTSVDYDGTEKGFDYDLIKSVTGSVSIPVIASGGAGELDDFTKCINECGADAVASGSLLHYKKCGVAEIKDALSRNNIMVRDVPDAKRVGINLSQGYDIVDYNKHLLKQLRDESMENNKPKEYLKHSLDAVHKDDGIDFGVIDCGVNNVKSVVKAFEKIGEDAKPINTPEEVYSSRALVLPGVGTFESGMASLRKYKLINPLREKVKSGTPLLGICLGMQLLFTESEEFGLHKGLNFIDGRITSLKNPSMVDVNGYKLPHIGWNELHIINDSDISSNIIDNSSVYFLHSFIANVNQANPEYCTASTTYGGQEFCAVAEKNNILGMQFHPEKSGGVGLSMLKNFCEEAIQWT